MPNYFTLTKIGESEPTALAKIDEELCKFLGEPVHEKDYVYRWFDTIGLRLACGDSLHDILAYYMMRREETDDPYFNPHCEIADYLLNHYEPKSWASR